jgi:hypothetical protein
LTLEGKIAYSRNVLRPARKKDMDAFVRECGGKSIAPLDDALGVVDLPFKMTPLAMAEVAYWAQNQGSYSRAAQMLKKRTHIAANPETVRLVANHVGNIAFEADKRRANEVRERLDAGKLNFVNDRDGVLYIETDGAALNTRTKDDKGSTWRENKLGVVFSTDGMRYWTSGRGERQHKITRKELVSFVGTAEDFKWHLFACALRNGYGSYRRTVLISDGATWIRNIKKELFPDAQQILDYYHLCENVNTFAKYIFKDNESKWRPWSDGICDRIKKSMHEDVLREIEQFKGANLPPGVPNLFSYISNNSENIDYAEYIRNGYFIGSGAIESSNKTVLQYRLKQAGMRWNVESAQPILTLRAKCESDLWDEVISLLL